MTWPIPRRLTLNKEHEPDPLDQRKGPADDLPAQLPRWLVRATAWLCWGYLAVVVATWILLRFTGDRWWVATLMLFGPRWLCSLPIFFLVPLAAFVQRKLMRALAAAMIVVAFPILGFSIPWARAFAPAGYKVRLLTYNTLECAVPADALSALIREVQPDVVALQEYHPGAYTNVFRDWHVCQDGELLVAAQFPIKVRRITSSLQPPHVWPRTTMLECVVSTPVADFTVCNVHLPSPRYGLTAVVDRRTILSPSRRALLENETANRDAVSAIVAEANAESHSDRIVAGDFNMPTDSTLYQRDWSGYTNAFLATGWGLGYTLRASLQGWEFGARIDHVLMDGDWRPLRCWVGPNIGSDHLPVIADLIWQGRTLPAPVGKQRAKIDPTAPRAIPEEQPLPAPLPLTKDNLRTWTSTNGYKIEAEFLGVLSGTAKLKKANGTLVSVPITKLSTEDQEYIQHRSKVSAHHGQDLGAAVGEREQFYFWRERYCSNWRRWARRVALASAR